MRALDFSSGGLMLHKQSFNALMRYKIDRHLPIKESIANLRWKTNVCNLFSKDYWQDPLVRIPNNVALLPSNHIEADTRFILETSKSDLPVVIKATDTDVLVLMC